MIHLSQRFPEQLDTTDFARRLARRRTEAGESLVDVMVSNPTDALDEARREYRGALREAVERSLDRPYRPDPRGLREAREAVSDYYADRGADVPADHIVLTASTSEAYGWVTKLLCDPGDAIAHPVPSYPLFEHLLRLESVQARDYRLRYTDGWTIDFGDLADTLDARPGCRAIIGVNPNNPTGHILEAPELERLRSEARARDLAVIVDEVFADFPVERSHVPSVLETAPSAADAAGPLTFVLSGFSKVAGLPGLKLGWIAVDGEDDDVERALERLAFIRDAYLSTTTPTELAAPAIFEARHTYQQRLRDRIAANRRHVRECFADRPAWEDYPVEGGWYQILRYPATVEETDFTLALLDDRQVAVHPGFFYDLRRGRHLVVSLLTTDSEFRRGLEAIVDVWDRRYAP